MPRPMTAKQLVAKANAIRSGIMDQQTDSPETWAKWRDARATWRLAVEEAKDALAKEAGLVT